MMLKTDFGIAMGSPLSANLEMKDLEVNLLSKINFNVKVYQTFVIVFVF